MAKKTTKKKTGPKRKLATIRHDQMRTNIPTEELLDFVSDKVQKPTKVLYRSIHGDIMDFCARDLAKEA